MIIRFILIPPIRLQLTGKIMVLYTVSANNYLQRKYQLYGIGRGRRSRNAKEMHRSEEHNISEAPDKADNMANPETR